MCVSDHFSISGEAVIKKAVSIVLIILLSVIILRLPTGLELRNESFHSIASSGKVEEMEKLISEGFNINSTDDNGDTALFYALSHENMPMANYLFSKGARVNTIDRTGLPHATKIRSVCDSRLVNEWLDIHGAE